MADIQVGKAPKERAVIPFYATGALFFVLMSVLLFFSSQDLLSGQYFSPKLLALVHSAALGWASMLIFGAAYQMLPVVCQRDLYSSKLALLSYLLLLVGSLGLICSFWHFITGWFMIISGGLILASALLYSVNVYATAWGCKHANIASYFLLSSAFWLCFTCSFGVILALNLKFGFISTNHLELLKLHAHAGIVGWFLQLICGVGMKLIPMFLLGKSKREGLSRSALILQNIGLLSFLAHGYFSSINRSMLIELLFISAGICCWLLYIIDCYRNRARKKVDLLMKQSAFSLLGLLMAILCAWVMLSSGDNKWLMLYAESIFLVWISGIILGKTFKTLPFIVWNKRYKQLNGKIKIPMPKDLYIQKLIPYQLGIYLCSVIGLSAGLFFQQEPLISLSSGLWILLSLIYAINVFRVILHQPKINHGN